MNLRKVLTILICIYCSLTYANNEAYHDGGTSCNFLFQFGPIINFPGNVSETDGFSFSFSSLGYAEVIGQQTFNYKTKSNNVYSFAIVLPHLMFSTNQYIESLDLYCNIQIGGHPPLEYQHVYIFGFSKLVEINNDSRFDLSLDLFYYPGTSLYNIPFTQGVKSSFNYSANLGKNWTISLATGLSYNRKKYNNWGNSPPHYITYDVFMETDLPCYWDYYVGYTFSMNINYDF